MTWAMMLKRLYAPVIAGIVVEWAWSKWSAPVSVDSSNGSEAVK